MINKLLQALFSLLVLLVGLPAFAQAPNQFKYQSIARNSSGEILQNIAVSLQISIRDISPTGTIVFQETHLVTTNDFGLFSVSIGNGTVVSGTIASIDWATGSKYIEIEGDLSGGTNYESFGTSELLSVPYALYANTAGVPLMPNGTDVGNTSFWNGSSWSLDNYNIYNAGQQVGIGTNSPVQKLHVNGNINIPLDSSYMINNRKVLWVNGTANLFVGINAGASNSIGFSNSFLGYNSGATNSVGSQNTFLGAETGSANLDGMMNSFMGRRAGFLNTNGNENTFIGAYAGQSNTEGQHNSFLGVTAGTSNTLGEENTFLGAHSGYFNVIGNFNSFVGNFSGVTNTTGSYNTIVGFQADVQSSNLTNASAFGYGAIVNSSNSVIIGNTSVTSIGGQVGWSTFSDKRLKTNIEDFTLGLNFIQQLNPVQYEYKADGQKSIVYAGLIAQDVEKILDKSGLEFSGLVKPKNEADYYSIRYGEFVIPLINAVQEQQLQIDDLKEENKELLKRLEELEKRMERQSKEK
jgi:hypothetical protein